MQRTTQPNLMGTVTDLFLKLIRMNCTSSEGGVTVSLRTTGSKRKQKYLKHGSNPSPRKQGHRARRRKRKSQDSLGDAVEYFRVEHPPDRLILCNRWAAKTSRLTRSRRTGAGRSILLRVVGPNRPSAHLTSVTGVLSGIERYPLIVGDESE